MEKNPAVSANDTQDAVSKNNNADIATLQSNQDDDPIYISERAELIQHNATNQGSEHQSKTKSKHKAHQAPSWEMSAKDALKVNYLSRNKTDTLEPF